MYRGRKFLRVTWSDGVQDTFPALYWHVCKEFFNDNPRVKNIEEFYENRETQTATGIERVSKEYELAL